MELGHPKAWGASNSSASLRQEDHLHRRQVRPVDQAIVSLGLNLLLGTTLVRLEGLIRQSDFIRPLIGEHRDGMAAVIIRAIDQETADA